MARGRKPKTENKQEVYTDLEPKQETPKTREEVFSDLNSKVETVITAFEMAAKENRELAFRIIAAKKSLERIGKTLK